MLRGEEAGRFREVAGVSLIDAGGVDTSKWLTKNNLNISIAG